MYRRPLIALICILLVWSAAACSRADVPDPRAGGTADRATISIMANLFTREPPSDMLLSLIEEETETDLDITWVPIEAYVDKLNSSFSTRTLPQVVYLKNQSTFQHIKELIYEEHFWEIGPYLHEYEHLGKLKPGILANTEVNGKIYALYLGRPLARQGVIYRQDWADRLGLDAPGNVDELYEMLRQFTEEDPDGNGLADTIGLSDRNDLVYGAFKTVASYFGTPNYWGMQDGRLLPEFMFPAYRETMDYFRMLVQNGYMNADFPLTSKDNQWDLFVQGKAGVYIGSLEDVQRLQQELARHDTNALLDVQNLIAGPDGGYGIWSIPGYGNVLLFPKESVRSEEELRRILTFYDATMTPKIANLMFWGIENRHYTVENGKAKEIEDHDLIDQEVRNYRGLLIGEPETNGRYEASRTVPAAVKAEALIHENEQFLIHDPTNPLYSPTDVEKGTLLQEIITNATYEYILGEIDAAGFDAAIQAWLEQGGEQVMQEYNRAYRMHKYK
ncbi:extracellular solute-binding protein [Xylanibacillus composti]|uniref:Putative ABC transporter peptide-binding protein YtcQ n=1 Tax=Xylanibacillus composti TaxID=1572762 RepID=A0A8J4H6D8_9BACL|nr:extracellular solute-binding protein [Xylanibacillus composti]MDT9726352.1 extracellular solute-binding protein [Xylanibacillus composti]GIQ70540.1 putative ABC transporter peptide-binding protein YtcQ [Xylanibacillus composti]